MVSGNWLTSDLNTINDESSVNFDYGVFEITMMRRSNCTNNFVSDAEKCRKNRKVLIF